MSLNTMGLIMAGGAGERMARSNVKRPKTLVEVGGYPLIVLLIHRLVAIGIRDIRISVHHRAQEIIHLLRSRHDLPQPSLGFIVEEEPLGTIGALAELCDEGRNVLVQNGDLLSGINLRSFLDRHESSAADLTIATHIEYHQLKLGEITVHSSGRVANYREKPVKRYRISSGTYLIAPDCLHLLAQSTFTSLPEFTNLAIERGHKVVEFHHDAPWIDVNDAHDLRRAQHMFDEDPIAFGIHPVARKVRSEEAT